MVPRTCRGTSNQYDGLWTEAVLVEHFTMELRRESADNLLEKFLDGKLGLLGSIRNPATGFMLMMDEEDDHDPMNDRDVVVERKGKPCKKSAHFINPPMFCFCSNYPSVMVKLRKDCLSTNEFEFEYGLRPMPSKICA